MPTPKERKSIEHLLRPHLRGFRSYAPVDPPQILAEKLGVKEDAIVKLDGNENPYGPLPDLGAHLAHESNHAFYPDPLQRRARHALSNYTGLSPDWIVAGAGADELINLILRMVINTGDRVLTCDPTFGIYSFATTVQGGQVISLPRGANFEIDLEGCLQAATDGAKIVFLCSPNNPTGNLTPNESVEALLSKDILVVVDETYYEFSGHTVASLIPEYWNLIVLRSFSKWAGLAGIRAGYALMSPLIADRLLQIKDPYNLSTAAEIALLASLEQQSFLMERVAEMVRERDRLASKLNALPGVTTWPSKANFLLCQISSGQASNLHSKLAGRGIFVRCFDHPRLENCLRISVGLRKHTDILIETMAELLE